MAKQNDTKLPTKLDKAFSDARARDAARNAPEGPDEYGAEGRALVPPPSDGGAELVPPMPEEASAEIVTVSPAELASFVARALAEDGATMAPVMLTLEIGQSISGTLARGPGAELKKQDTRTGEEYFESVPNWIITTPMKTRFALLETSQLSTQLPPYDGGFVTIIRGEDFNVKGKRVTRYITIGKEAKKQLAAPSTEPAK